MHFETGHIYHIYNQGNNRDKIFFEEKNYYFFLEKLKTHVIPFSDILAWCLMPNHFHLLVYITKTESDFDPEKNKSETRARSLQQSIGIMLASYTRAINQSYNRSGSLFRKETKAICVTKVDKIARSWLNSQGVTMVNAVIPENQYPNICFNYILFNPLKDRLVKKNEDWKFSSYADTINLRKGKLISRERIREFGLEVNENDEE
ncbi:MAG: transposase [Bacteroidales bacterium]|nr:transposase [Bacteroidales bacterium]